MKPNRRSPVFRATARFLALTLIMPIALLAGRANAQSPQQALRVIVADFVNRSPNGGPTLGVNATAAVYNELINAGQGKFYVFQTAEVQKEAQTLGIRTPSVPGQPSNFSDPDLLRIAKSLGADAVVRGYVSSSPLVRGRPVQVSLDVRVKDIASDEEINGGVGSIRESPRPGQVSDPEELLNKGVEDVAQDVIRQVTQHELFVATILNVNGNVAILNIGTKNSLHVGDDLTVYRLTPNGTVKVGRLKAARVYPGDSEADISENIGGIQIEDLARIIYRPSAVIPTNGTGALHSTPHNAAFSLSAIGATLAVIGLGVVVASSARGGQASVSGVRAEAGATSGSAIVRVTWSDNVFGSAGIQQYKIFRLPDFPFGTVGTGGTGGGGGGNTNAAGVPVGTSTPTIRSFTDMPSPNFHYLNGAGFLVGTSNGGLNTGGGNGSGGGSGNNQQNCTVTTPANAATLDVGFLPGRSYRYQVTAVILRQSSLSGGNQNGSGGGGGVGGGGGSGNSGGAQCIETDPVQSGLATPIVPVILTFPSNQTGSINIMQFAPTFASRNGADVFQLEISTDRTFKNPSLIFKLQITSTAPNSDGVTQSVPSPIDLTTLPELLRDPTFNAFVTASSGSTPTLPTIFWRVGARHDEDDPGPINFISQSASDKDRTFRFVYTDPFSFTPAPVPPPPPGRIAAILNRQYASGRKGSVLPLPGDTDHGRGASLQRVLTPQEILTGRGRVRH